MTNAGWTQTQLANNTGITPAGICSYLNGKREPSIKSLLKICTALNTTPNDLLSFHGAEKSVMAQKVIKLEDLLTQINKITNEYSY